jgi:hypothetical protein
MPDGSTMVSCSSGGSPDMLMAAVTANKTELFIAAATVQNEKNNYYHLVDVYDRSSLAYRRTLKIKNAGKGDFLLDIEASDDALYCLAKKQGVIKIIL